LLILVDDNTDPSRSNAGAAESLYEIGTTGYWPGAFGAAGAFGALGGFGAPGAIGAFGAIGAPGAIGAAPIMFIASSFAWSASKSTFIVWRGAPHSAHSFAMGLFILPHTGHLFICISAGLKHTLISSSHCLPDTILPLNLED